ncbi:MAG: hypothetical protein KDD65_02730 [Bacteroidetes bacterium]|nr:hypothetical protein [Bacteroidota bacterium]
MRKKPILYAIALLFVGFVLLDSLGVFDDKDYYEVPHGSHTHYVAKDKDPDVSVGQFPTRPPRENERITPQGQIVPK